MAFDPNKHMIRMGGPNGKEYLPVAPRLVWFREEHPDWGIVTEPLKINMSGDPETGRPPFAIFRAQVFDANGKLIATGTKYEDAKGFPDFVEKAKTSAVGRALAICGYGTMNAPELDEGERLADAPQFRGGQPGNAPQRAPQAPERRGAAPAGAMRRQTPEPEPPAAPAVEEDAGAWNEARSVFQQACQKAGWTWKTEAEEAALFRRVLPGVTGRPTPEQFLRAAKQVPNQARFEAEQAEGGEGEEDDFSDPFGEDAQTLGPAAAGREAVAA